MKPAASPTIPHVVLPKTTDINLTVEGKTVMLLNREVDRTLLHLPFEL